MEEQQPREEDESEESVELMLAAAESDSDQEQQGAIAIAPGAAKYARPEAGGNRVSDMLERLPPVPRAAPELPEYPPSFDIDMESLQSRPWTNAGTDITDWFNYGFDEGTWAEYCRRQVHTRLAHHRAGKIRVHGAVPVLAPQQFEDWNAMYGMGRSGRNERSPSRHSRRSKSPDSRRRSRDYSRERDRDRRDRDRDRERESRRRDDDRRRRGDSEHSRDRKHRR